MFLCKKEQCTGCCACMNICPKDAITMHPDEFGCVFPEINLNKCVNCGVCEKICPVLSKCELNNVKDCYAVWHRERETVKNSASAGLVTALADTVIKNDGVVFGTHYQKNNLIFDYADNLQKVRSFQGSKYVQADVGYSYRKIKEFLVQKRQVLFVGTPCQIAGLKNYLQNEYSNLFTVDLICHGVASQNYLNEYLHKKIGNKSYNKVLFRGPEGEKTAVYYDKELIYLKNKSADLFFSAYAKSLINRENCYACQYADTIRTGDITAGDFWGINRQNLNNDASGVPYISLALINTLKGEQLFELAKDSLIVEKRDIHEALVHNKQLCTPCIRHPERNIFLKKYLQKGFVAAVKSTTLYRAVVKAGIRLAVLALLQKIKNFLRL